MKKFFALLTLILILAAFGAADVYVKTKNHSDPISIMGQKQPAKDFFSEQWIGDGQVAMISEGQSVLIDLKKSVMDIINHTNKTYLEAPLPFDFSSLLPAEMAGMMQSMMKMTITVTPTGQNKTFGTWNCDEYDVVMNMMMMPMKMKVYTTTNVPFDLKGYMEKIYGNIMKAQFRLDETATKEMAKIKGFWIASETNAEMMGAKIRAVTEVVEISNKPAPAGVYAVPAGYTKRDKLSMEDLKK